ncbi:MAG: hypothetical protein R3321_11375 [Nitrososphaeraceae archaeon]|nr:hypothetical protein [Nitrososphaeraceae archaeon]
MKFGFDLDNTITEAPEMWAAIINALSDAGHETHIITYRHPVQHLKDTKKELEMYGIRYDHLHLVCDKEEICRIWKIDMAFDDDPSIHYPNAFMFKIFCILPNGPVDNNIKPDKLFGCFDGSKHSEKREGDDDE